MSYLKLSDNIYAREVTFYPVEIINIELEQELLSLVDSPLLKYPDNATNEIMQAVDMYNEPFLARNIMNNSRREELQNLINELKAL